MEISGRDYRSGEAVTLVLRNRHVSERRLYSGPVTIDSLPWIAPGLVDLQSNGHGGQEFSSPELTVEHVERIAKQQATFGVTQFLPTITTAARTTLEHGCRTIAAAVEQ